MRLAPGEDIGREAHPHLDQFLRIESGAGRVEFGRSEDEVEETHDVEGRLGDHRPGRRVAQRGEYRRRRPEALLAVRATRASRWHRPTDEGGRCRASVTHESLRIHTGTVGPDRRATTRPASQPGARPPGGGWSWSVSTPARASSHEISELEFHMSPVCSSSRPHTGVGTDGTRSRTRCARARSFATRSGLDDRLVRIGDGASAPSTDLVAEQPEPSRPSRPDRALGDDATLSSALVWDRRGLDDEPAVGDAHLQGGVEESAPRAMLDEGFDRLVDLPVQADHVAARAQRDPVEVDRPRRGHG